MGISQKGNKIRLTGKGVGKATSVQGPVSARTAASDINFEKTVKGVLGSSVDNGEKKQILDEINSAREKLAAATASVTEHAQRAEAFREVEEDLKQAKRDIRAAIAARPERITLEEQAQIDAINYQLTLNDEFRKADSEGLYQAKWAVAEAINEKINADKKLESITGDYLVKPYTENTIGHAVAIGEAEANSSDWHTMRYLNEDGNFVMTGSRAWVADGGYSPYSNEENLINNMLDGLNPESERQPNIKSSAMALGDAMEEPIQRLHAEKHPDETHWHTKATYESVEDRRFRANIDGLYSSTGGDKPDGVLEIKTASHYKEWEDEEGNDKIPAWYESQMKHYCATTGLRKSRIVVMINQYDFRQIDREFSEEDIATYKAKALDFLGKVEERRLTV